MAILQALTLLSLSLVARGAPTDPNIQLARQYAPQWRFHPSEQYWPSTIDFFLSNVKLVDDSGNTIANQPGLTSSNLADAAAAAGTSTLYLATDINAGLNGFLKGQNPSSANPGPMVNTFIVPKSNGIVDLYYWLFTPYNLGKSVPLLGEIDVGDWERLTVRTVNGVATEVDYHAHGDTGSGTIPWDQAPKFDNNNRPVGYVAKGSHGFWSSAGTFTYVNAVIFKLQDETADNGVYFDTQNSLIPLAYPDTYTGDQAWLNFQGAWGNKGDTSCWWYAIHDECKIVTGPPGPVRSDVLGSANAKVKSFASSLGGSSLKADMNGALSHTLGKVSTEAKSSYTIHVAKEALAAAAEGSALAIQQTCAPFDPSVANATTTTATVPLSKDSTTFTLTPDACAAEFNVASYSIGLYLDGDYTFNTNLRNVRAFSTDKNLPGPQNTTTIVINDLIDWSL